MPSFQRGPRSRPSTAAGVLVATILTLLLGSSLPAQADVLPTGIPAVRAGGLSGPIPIPAGSTLRTVAHLALGKGEWTVLAKGVIRSTATSLITQHVASCALVVGARRDRTSAAPIGSGNEASRVPFLVALTAHRTAPTTATLRCSAPGSSTGTLVLEDLRIAAISTLGLQHRTLTDIAWTVDAGSLLRSAALDVRGTTAVPIPGVEGTVATIPIPTGGDWVVTAKGTVAGASAVTRFTCVLTQGDFDRTAGGVAPNGSVADRAPIALQIIHHFSGPGVVSLGCGRTGGTADLRDLRLIAYQAATAHNQDQGVDTTFPAEARSHAPVVDAAYRDGPVLIPPGSTFQPVASLGLPKGRWLLVAKLLLSQTTAAVRTAECRLGAGGSWDRARLILGASGSLDDQQGLMLVWHHRFTAPGAVLLRCRVGGLSAQVSFVKVMAYQAGSLATLHLR